MNSHDIKEPHSLDEDIIVQYTPSGVENKTHHGHIHTRTRHCLLLVGLLEESCFSYDGKIMNPDHGRRFPKDVRPLPDKLLTGRCCKSEVCFHHHEVLLCEFLLQFPNASRKKRDFFVCSFRLCFSSPPFRVTYILIHAGLSCLALNGICFLFLCLGGRGPGKRTKS